METPAKKTILVIEDELPAAMALADMLTQEGFEVLRADNGEDGLKTAFEKHPDLLLVDIQMPRMNGIQMIKQLRTDPWGATAKVIILTNLTDLEHVREAIEESTFHYFIKGDTSMDKIVESIREQLAVK